MNEHLLYKAFQQDLEWILNTPSLLQGSDQLFDPASLTTLDTGAIKPPPNTLKNARMAKLGHYFEFLVKTLFEAHPDYRILADNRVISEQRRTLGELDLLLEYQPSGQILHLELALKFYLFVPGTQTPDQAWVGAGLHDFLHLKLQRLWEHQLQLPKKAQAARCWPEDLPIPDQSRVWIPGRLYVPEQAPKQEWQQTEFSGTPWSLNQQARTSHWFETGHLDSAKLQALSKAEWLNGQPADVIERPLPAQFCHSDFELPVYVLPFDWYNQAKLAIHQHQQRL